MVYVVNRFPQVIVYSVQVYVQLVFLKFLLNALVTRINEDVFVLLSDNRSL
jgi:hypothetical protein